MGTQGIGVSWLAGAVGMFKALWGYEEFPAVLRELSLEEESCQHFLRGIGEFWEYQGLLGEIWGYQASPWVCGVPRRCHSPQFLTSTAQVHGELRDLGYPSCPQWGGGARGAQGGKASPGHWPGGGLTVALGHTLGQGW